MPATGPLISFCQVGTKLTPEGAEVAIANQLISIEILLAGDRMIAVLKKPVVPLLGEKWAIMRHEQSYIAHGV